VGICLDYFRFTFLDKLGMIGNNYLEFMYAFNIAHMLSISYTGGTIGLFGEFSQGIQKSSEI
jgi:hypothetical protein